MASWSRAVLVLATLGAALMAGTFFIFSVAVMPAFRKLPAAGAAAAMRSINATILNPVFLGAFLGTTVLAGVLLYVGFTQGLDRRGGWLIAGALLYLLAVLGVTMAFNVPLNDRLAGADAAGAEAFWSAYEASWTPWNHVRTLGSVGATLAWVLAAIDR